MTTQPLRMVTVVVGLVLFAALVGSSVSAGDAPGAAPRAGGAPQARASAGPESQMPPTGFDMKRIDEFHAFLDKFDPDITRGYRFEWKKADSPEAIAALEKKLGFAVPAELRALWTTQGALHSVWFGDSWQTLTMDTAAEMAEHPVGLLKFIDHAWGGRPELAAWLPAEAAAKINADYIVFGYRYVDDNVHDYYFFDRHGRFGNLPFDQDDMTGARDIVRAMAKAAPAGESLDELLADQLATIRKAVEEEMKEGASE